MNKLLFAELSAWLMQAGLAGTAETDIVSGFCERCVAGGLPLARAVVFIDTLHPVHEGRLFRWGYDPAQAPSVLEYGRTSLDGLAATGFDPKDVNAAPGGPNRPFTGGGRGGSLCPAAGGRLEQKTGSRGFGI